MMMMMQKISYWLSEHPKIIKFRWSQTQSWGSTWSFLICAIVIYLVAATTIHLLVLLIVRRHRRPIPLGPIPAIHSLAMALLSTVIFLGILLSAAAEIRDTRWFLRRTNTTPFQWLLCFPLGIRPSGRVFFWSYVFYLSRFLHLFRTFFTIFQRRRLSFFHLMNQSIMIFKSFLWLEFSQSFQVLAILFTNLLYSVIYGYQFWTAIGLPNACFPLVVHCEVVMLVLNLVSHVGVLLLHFLKGGGCNGFGAWTCNTVLNGIVLLLFLKFYIQVHLKRKNRVGAVVEGSFNPSQPKTSGSNSMTQVDEVPAFKQKLS